MQNTLNEIVAHYESLNQRALDHFIMSPVSSNMITYLASQAFSVLKCEDPSLCSNIHESIKCSTSAYDQARTFPLRLYLPPLEEFIQSIIHRSQVQTPTLMSSIIYLRRLRQCLPSAIKGRRSTVHRIFMTCLVLAAKYLNDRSPKNVHWARYTLSIGYEGFSVDEINLMEKQLLSLLDWDLRITNEDLLDCFAPLLGPIHSDYNVEPASGTPQISRDIQPSRLLRANLLAGEKNSRGWELLRFSFDKLPLA